MRPLILVVNCQKGKRKRRSEMNGVQRRDLTELLRVMERTKFTDSELSLLKYYLEETCNIMLGFKQNEYGESNDGR